MGMARNTVKEDILKDDVLFENIIDEEVFFRRVLPDKNHYRRDKNGIRINSQAFADRNLEPSVDRHKLIERLSLGGARYTQGDLRNGVLSIRAKDVRAIQAPYAPPKQKVFKKLIERLALLANWEIRPLDLAGDDL